MATVRWHLDELTGETLTLRLYSPTSGTIANTGGDVMTEAGDGLFSATVGETLTGWYKAYADDDGGDVAASGWINMSDANPIVVENMTANSTTGAGAINYEHSVTDDEDAPLDGVEVWVTTDEVGTNVVAGTKSTDALGKVTFMLDAGTYYFWHQLSGYDFPTDPVEETVS
jgi:hypothetical protein